MARPQVADGETAFNMEGSCECIEQVVADSRQGVVSSLGVGRGAKSPHRKTDLFTKRIPVPPAWYVPLVRTMQCNAHGIWYMECKEHMQVWVTYSSGQGISKI